MSNYQVQKYQVRYSLKPEYLDIASQVEEYERLGSPTYYEERTEVIVVSDHESLNEAFSSLEDNSGDCVVDDNGNHFGNLSNEYAEYVALRYLKELK